MLNESIGFARGNLINAAGEITSQKAQYLLKNWLEPKTVGFLIAPPAAGKTAVTAAICSHIATGQAFANLRVRRSCIYYMGVEDPFGVKKRACVFLQNHDAEHVPFPIVTKAPDLSTITDADHIIDDVQNLKSKFSTPHALVVVDTANLAIGDSDENSAQHMSNVISNAELIANETDGVVLFLHHTSHGDTSRGRGSSVIRSNCDFELHLKPVKSGTPENLVQLSQVRMKNGPLQPPIYFDLQSVEIGRDDENDPVTVPAAISVDLPDGVTISQKNKPHTHRKTPRADDRKKEILRVLAMLDAGKPETYFTASEIIRLAGDEFNEVRSDPKSMQTVMRRCLVSLIEEGQVEEHNKKYRRVQRPQEQKLAHEMTK